MMTQFARGGRLASICLLAAGAGIAQPFRLVQIEAEESVDDGPEPIARVNQFVAARGLGTLILSWAIDYLDVCSEADEDQQPGTAPRCDTHYEVRLIGPDGHSLHRIDELVTPDVAARWNIEPTPETNAPTRLHYRRSGTLIVDVSSFTAKTHARFELSASIDSPSGHGRASAVSAMVYAPQADEIRFEHAAPAAAAEEEGPPPGAVKGSREYGLWQVRRVKQTMERKVHAHGARVPGQPLRFRARFAGAPQHWTSATVRGVLLLPPGNMPASAVVEARVNFRRGATEFVDFPVDSFPAQPAVQDFQIRWELGSITGDPEEPGPGADLIVPLGVTRHRIQVVPFQSPPAR